MLEQRYISLAGTFHTKANNYIDISLNNDYVDIILEASGMDTCNPAQSPGVLYTKGTADDLAQLDHEHHQQYRRLVGKI